MGAYIDNPKEEYIKYADTVRINTVYNVCLPTVPNPSSLSITYDNPDRTDICILTIEQGAKCVCDAFYLTSKYNTGTDQFDIWVYGTILSNDFNIHVLIVKEKN
jgi:hypothetical protein